MNVKHLGIKISLFLNYFVLAILLNSVGTVILQVQNNFGVSESSASMLEAFKDLSVAVASFLVASYIVRIGYKRTMLIALAALSGICLIIPNVPSFLMTKLLFMVVGISFALVKVSVFATIGLVTKDQKEHVSFMNFLESFFMIGILSGYFVFSYFIDDDDPASTSWFRVYYLLAFISALAFINLLFSKLDESEIQQEASKSMFADMLDMIRLAGKPMVIVFIFCAFLYVLIEQGIMSWLPTFNNRILNLPSSLSVEMASILALSTAIGRFGAGVILKKVKWYPVLTVCLLAGMILILLALPLANRASSTENMTWLTAPIAAYVFPLIGLFLAPIYPAINSVILSALPLKQHGPMSGLIVIFSALGGTTGSIITGNLFEYMGGQKAFYFTLIPIAILMVLLFVFNRRVST